MINFGDARLPLRFWQKIMPEPNSGCWLWTASLSPGGYGQYWVYTLEEKVNRKAHRIAYTTLVGSVSGSLDLDHLCRTRSCCNPAHLEPVTRSENLKRGVGGDRQLGQRTKEKRALVTHCKHGHEYTIENTWRQPGRNGRVCLTCKRDSGKESMRKRRVKERS